MRGIMYCSYCGKKLIGRSTKYCDNKCQADYRYQMYIGDWKKGIVSGMRGKYQISENIRRYLYEKHNSKCSRCGWGVVNSFTNIIPLEIEHIDGNYLNNRPENLDLICPNCHALTATYKGANKGNGRKDRDKYSLYGNPEQGTFVPCVETLYEGPKDI